MQDPEAGKLTQIMALKSRQQPAKKQPQGKGGTAHGKVLSEDEQVAMALAASMEQGSGMVKAQAQCGILYIRLLCALGGRAGGHGVGGLHVARLRYGEGSSTVKFCISGYCVLSEDEQVAMA